jgi:RNA polymerase sigma-70 factor (ECF subfamily)
MLEGVNNEKQAVDTREGHDQQAIVRETLDTLPTMYRMVLILRHLQDLTYEEMADILTMPIGTIKTQLFRARNLLKERLLAQHHQCLDSSS